jgi:hypothetical protein
MADEGNVFGRFRRSHPAARARKIAAVASVAAFAGVAGVLVGAQASATTSNSHRNTTATNPTVTSDPGLGNNGGDPNWGGNSGDSTNTDPFANNGGDQSNGSNGSNGFGGGGGGGSHSQSSGS